MTRTTTSALLAARRGGTLLTRDDLADISDVPTAYRVQRGQVSESGEGIAGWKLGGTSAPALELLGLNEPFLGPLSADAVFETGATVPVFEAHSPMLETEFAIVLGKDLPARDRPYARDEVLDGVASVHASFEIVAARIEGGFAGAGHLVIADHGVNVCVIVGERVPEDLWAAPEEIEIRVEINGSEAASGRSSALLWEHIFDGVAWLANRQADTARPVRKGDIVMTGTCTGVTKISAGDTAKAVFGEVAVVSARFLGREP